MPNTYRDEDKRRDPDEPIPASYEINLLTDADKVKAVMAFNKAGIKYKLSFRKGVGMLAQFATMTDMTAAYTAMEAAGITQDMDATGPGEYRYLSNGNPRNMMDEEAD